MIAQKTELRSSNDLNGTEGEDKRRLLSPNYTKNSIIRNVQQSALGGTENPITLALVGLSLVSSVHMKGDDLAQLLVSAVFFFYIFEKKKNTFENWVPLFTTSALITFHRVAFFA